MPPVYYGVDVQLSRILDQGQVYGSTTQGIMEKLAKQAKPIIDAEADPVYRTIFGIEGSRFAPNYSTCEVWQAWMPGFTSKDPFNITDTINTVLNGTLSQAISADVGTYYVFLNGGCSYTGAGNSVTWTPFAGTTVPVADRDHGFICILAGVADITLSVDRVMMTLPKVGGGNYTGWLSLPDGYVLEAGEGLFFDYYGNCFSDRKMTKETFLSCFTIQPSEENLFSTGAIANELEYVKAHGRYIVNAMDVHHARNYELDHLASGWFNVDRRSGETDAQLIDRVLATVAGPKMTPYAIAQVLLKFSPWVILLEGYRGYGAYGRSFYHHSTDIPWSGMAVSGPYPDYVAHPFYSSMRGGLLYVRVKLQSNAVTTDPITGAFIYALLRDLLIAGCTYELELL